MSDAIPTVEAGETDAEIVTALHVSETTVKTHVWRVLVKLDLLDHVQAVVHPYVTGLVRPGDHRG